MKSVLLLVVTIILVVTTKAQQLNGFNLKEALIPQEDILRGGPPRDGIPSIDQPVFLEAGNANEYGNSSQVLGVYYKGIAKAYPINIMDWHEIVNDHFAGEPVIVSYCPLCGSGIAFKATVTPGKTAEFGVSGLLYNSDVLLYDRATHSLWSQIMGQAVSGPLKGTQLEPLQTQRLTLGAWKRQHPETLVLSTKTGFTRNYRSSPYGSYDQENRTYFPVSNVNDALHKKEWVIGITHKGKFKAYSVKRLAKLSRQQMTDQVGGETITLTWDKKAEHITVKDSQGKDLIGVQMFWFAWAAFHPETEVFK